MDPGVVLEKLVVSWGELPGGYLGPPKNMQVAKPQAAGNGRLGSC